MRKGWMIRFTASQWARGLTSILDLIALSALFLTGEVPSWIFGAAGTLWILSRFIRKEASIPALVALFLVTFAATLYFWFGLRLHPIVAVAYAAPAAHSLLWFAPRTATYRGWRIGLGFIELILSSVLTADIYVPVAISIFIVLTSVALSCDFMDRELALRAPDERDSLLDGAFIRNSIGMSVLIFLTAAIIFPILPRPKTTGTALELKAGYSESVNVGSWTRNRPDSGGETKLRIFVQDGGDFSTDLYQGLLRSRTLEVFDGKEWFSQRTPGNLARSMPGEAARSTLRLEAIRESLDSDALPVPYGTRAVHLMASDHQISPPQSRNGDWIASGSGSVRVNYWIDVIPNDLRYLKERASEDAPRSIHTQVPSSLENGALERLSRKLFEGTPDAQEKVRRVTAYLRNEGFTAIESAQINTDAIDQQLKKTKLHPIEQFLFITKQGHCEWFSTATALLLRMGGVPTRLVAGFRITRTPLGGILTVKSGDAHAWVETYIPNRGWLPVDPTPRLSASTGALDKIRQLGDLVGAYWYKYVVSFSDELGPTQIFKTFRDWSKSLFNSTKTSPAKNNGSALDQGPGSISLILGSTITALLGVGWFWRRRAEGDGAHPRLRAERRRVARLLRIRDIDPSRQIPTWFNSTERLPDPEVIAALGKWQDHYLSARFGARDHRLMPRKLDASVSELRSITREIESAIKQSPAALKA